MSVNNTGDSDKHAPTAQHHVVELEKNAKVDESDSESETTVDEDTKRCYKIAFISLLLVIITMTVGILIVCLTALKPSKLCQSSFKTLIDGDSIQQGSTPYSIATGDFNHDALLDLAIANSGSNTIGIFLSYGNGTFAPQITFSTGSYSRPLFAAVGDFNNDTHLDIAVANYDAHNIGVFLGYGNGTFHDVMTFSTGKGSAASSVTVADINNDSQLDIIVANYGTNNVGVFLGYGNGSFAEQLTSSTGTDSAPWSTAVGDFNKDGLLDLAVASYRTSSVVVLYGYGNGTFGNLRMYSTGIGSNPTMVKVADFNNDNHLDIIVGDETIVNLGILFGYSDGTFTSVSPVPIGEGSYTYGLAVGNFNHDNYLDFAVADTGNNNIGIFLSSGSKPFGGQTTFYIGKDSRPSSVAVGHFNNDSQLDIVTTNYGTNSISILFGYGNRLFSNTTTYSTGNNSYPISLTIGDLNNDSLTDIAVTNSMTNNIVVFIAHGNGWFSNLITYSTGKDSQPVSIAVGDFNIDNRLDLAVANFGTNNVCLLFGDGNGTFTNQTWYSLGYDSRPIWVASKDFNNDNRDDIAVATYGTGNVGILLNIC